LLNSDRTKSSLVKYSVLSEEYSVLSEECPEDRVLLAIGLGLLNVTVCNLESPTDENKRTSIDAGLILNSELSLILNRELNKKVNEMKYLSLKKRKTKFRDHGQEDTAPIGKGEEAAGATVACGAVGS